jgi:hypothetical protein
MHLKVVKEAPDMPFMCSEGKSYDLQSQKLSYILATGYLIFYKNSTGR